MNIWKFQCFRLESEPQDAPSAPEGKILYRAWLGKKSSSKGQQKTPGKTMGKPLKNGDFFNKHAQLSNKNGKGKHENMG